MGFTFGAPTANAPAPAGGATGFSFGAPAAAPAASSGGGFSFGAPKADAGKAATTTPAPAAAGGGLFGKNAPAPATGAAPAPAGGGFSFGAPTPAAATTTPAPAAAAKSETAKPATTAAPAAGGGGFSFGGAPAATKAPAPSAGGGGFSFGGGGASSTAAPAAKEVKAAPALAAAGGGGFSFGGAPAASSTKDAAKDATATPAAKTGFSFGGATPGTTPAAKAPSPVKTPNTTAGGAATTPAPAFASPAATTMTPATASVAKPAAAAAPQKIEPPPIEYQSLTIEQILNRFQSELETDAIAFMKEAQRVAHYDATLRDTQRSLGELTDAVSRLMLHQSEVDAQLQGIGSYQRELGGTLDLLERNVDELFAAQSHVHVGDADVEREQGYERALDVDARLDGMAAALAGVVNDLNTAQERVWSSSGAAEEGKDGEVGKIIGVFNAHHETLAYLEGKARALESDVAVIGQVLAKSGQ